MRVGYSDKFYLQSCRIRGAMVARLTPDQKVACSIHVGSNGHGLGSNRTELLSHGLTVYWFQKKLMVWFGLNFL